MANSYSQVFVHMVFSTKHREPIIRKEDFARLNQYVMTLLEEKQCYAVIVGGVENHLHILFVLDKTVSVSEVAKHVKAVTSKWLKSLSPWYSTFLWQDGYAAFSVSKSLADRVKNYIANQEQHHHTQSFEDEVRYFCKLQGMEVDEKYLFD